jgi:hypothetical protein
MRAAGRTKEQTEPTQQCVELGWDLGQQALEVLACDFQGTGPNFLQPAQQSLDLACLAIHWLVSPGTSQRPCLAARRDEPAQDAELLIGRVSAIYLQLRSTPNTNIFSHRRKPPSKAHCSNRRAPARPDSCRALPHRSSVRHRAQFEGVAEMMLRSSPVKSRVVMEPFV